MRKLILAVLLCAAPALAQPPPAPPQGPGPGHPPEDQLGTRLFPPDLIMSHQQALGIDDKQRAAIIREIDKMQPQVQQIQWQLHAAMEQLVQLLDGGRVDEAKALALADKVMNLERDMKKAHLGMLIRIRNLLTDAQRTHLLELRKRGG